jgi:hypothetical protein
MQWFFEINLKLTRGGYWGIEILGYYGIEVFGYWGIEVFMIKTFTLIYNSIPHT